MDKLSNEAVIGNLREFLKKVNKKYPIDKAILFGSRARHDWLYSSDVDIIIVSRGFAKINFLDRIRFDSRMWEHNIELQAICYTPEEFSRKKMQIGIVCQAVKEGKELAAA